MVERQIGHTMKRYPIRKLFLALALVTPSLACGARSHQNAMADGGELVDECKQYLAVYGACMQHMSPRHPEVAAARVESARQALLNQPNIDALRTTCADGMAQIQKSCE